MFKPLLKLQGTSRFYFIDKSPKTIKSVNTNQKIPVPFISRLIVSFKLINFRVTETNFTVYTLTNTDRTVCGDISLFLVLCTQKGSE